MLLVVVAVGATFVPKLVDEVNGLVAGAPDYVHDLTHGRGRLGFLERKYHVVEKVREQVKNGGAKKRARALRRRGLGDEERHHGRRRDDHDRLPDVLHAARGRNWVERLSAPARASRSRAGAPSATTSTETVGGYVTGNILISLIAGVSITIVLLLMGVPYAVALGLLVAILDLIPLAGATVAGIIVAIVAFLHSVPAGIIVVVFFVVYQQLENHFLQPVIYGRTVQLSPLVVLISVLVGAELAGILGALAAIPVAGTFR